MKIKCKNCDWEKDCYSYTAEYEALQHNEQHIRDKILKDNFIMESKK